jgi:hypothetical protein
VNNTPKVTDEMVEAALPIFMNYGQRSGDIEAALKHAIAAALTVVGKVDENNRLRPTGAYAIERKHVVTQAMVSAAWHAYRGAGQCDTPMENAIHAALEISGLTKNPLPFVASLPVTGDTFEEMQANVDRNSTAYAQGDMVLRWVNEGAILLHDFQAYKDSGNAEHL